MRLGVLYSGGKDSNLALLKALEYGHEVSCLIHILSENQHSYMFHTPLQELVGLQAKALEIPMVEIRTKGIREKELEDLKKAVSIAKSKHGIEGIVTGAVKSVYQSSRIQKICKDLDLWVFNPLWLRDEMELMKEASRKMEVMITGVAAYPLTKEWLGRVVDESLVDELDVFWKKYGISPAGEGGELETFVLDSEAFKKRIRLEYDVEWKDYSGRIVPRRAWLEARE